MPVNPSQAAPTPAGAVAVLLATYDGAAFLEEQLGSIIAQTHSQIDVWASDDGSTDGTKSILEEWAGKWSKGAFHICAGPGKGFAENFRSLLQRVPGDYAGYCFCDQDDVWLPRKIDRSLAAIAGAKLPIVYGARTRLVDADGQPIGFSPLFMRSKSFENALVQSMAGGNTMMLNSAAFALMATSAARTGFVTHDWWAYILITGCGGKAIYDAEPNLDYRQHANNIIGKNSGLKATWRRIAGVRNGQFRAWTASNIASLDACADMLSPSAQRTLDHLKQAHSAKPPMGLKALYRSHVYRQNLQGNAMLWLAGVMGWL